MLQSFTEQQEMFRETARKFAINEVEPIANQADLEETFPDELLRKCAEIGFYGLYTSEEYGGSGHNLTAACLVLEEISKASPSLGGMLIKCTNLVVSCLFGDRGHRGTET